jgi:hypothetical protein
LREKKLSYPEAHRILPTMLGNTLRAAEDQLAGSAESEDVQGYVLRHGDRIIGSLADQQSGVRARLDMYCTLAFTFIVLAVTVMTRSIMSRHWAPAIQWIGLYSLFALISYRAAIATARHYGTVLAEISRQVSASTSTKEPDIPQPREGERDSSATIVTS